MVNCQGCGEETSSRLCCPKCSEYGRTSFFCSQECFVSSWPSHSKLHVIIRQIALSSNPSSSYDARGSQGFSADDAVAVSPATTAASVSATGEEGLFHKKTQSGVTSAQAVETRSRSRILSRAGSETELPVVSSSGASSSFSRASGVGSASSSSSSSRDPPVLSPAGVVPTDEGISVKNAPFNGSRDNPEDEFTAGGVLSAVRSLLLPKTRDKTEEKAEGGRPAAPATGAAARVTQAVRSVFSTSHNRHYVAPCSNRKKDAGLVVTGREASGRSSAAVSTAVASPAGVGFCRCVVLALICVFCLLFMWMMRRILFDGVGASSAYYGAHQDEVAANRGEALSDSNDVVSAVLARIGARPYGEEISALQASVQDIRNELAAITTLVQQHGVVIDQFIEKPNFSGRRQGGGGGAINQAISAFLEGGPPLPDTPQLKLPLVASAVAVSDRKGGAGVSEAAHQEAVASPHSALRRAGAVTAGATTEADAGIYSQKFYEANVTMEGDRAWKQAAVQPPSPGSTQEQQQWGSSQGQQASGTLGTEWSDSVTDGNPSLSGPLLNAAVKSSVQLTESRSAPQAETLLRPGASEADSTGPRALVYTEGSPKQLSDLAERPSRVEQRGEGVNVSAAQAVDARPATAHIRAPAEEGSRQEERFRRTLEGENLFTSGSVTGIEEQGSKANGKLNKSKEQYTVRRRQPFRGNRDTGETGREGDEKGELGKTSYKHKKEPNQSSESSAPDSFGLGGVTGRGAKRAKRSR